ncbi:hypothetical protein GALL_536510 [mine drainage metagenome]|uniref:Uncharacterized protein n=1 Tax=mine drainage metagenome TaxID=410659 RepID=A0A1J5PMJ5_9ZZZZ
MLAICAMRCPGLLIMVVTALARLLAGVASGTVAAAANMSAYKELKYFALVSIWPSLA